MAADTVTPAILQYVNHSAYPDSEDVSSANLGPDALANLLQELHKAQDEVKTDIKALSKNTAPDIDTWISRAKDLQVDIQRSRETARQIVAEHETGKQLKAKVDDTKNKVALLEKEVAYEETLAGTLEHIRYANASLDAVQEAALRADVEGALGKLDEAEASIAGLDALRDTKACGLLQSKAKGLKENIIETTTECWNGLIQVDAESKSISILDSLPADVLDVAVEDLTLDMLVQIAQAVGVAEPFRHKLSRDIERTVLRPRLTVDDEQQVGKITLSDDQVACSERQDDLSIAALVADLQRLIGFLAAKLPHSVAVPLSDTLIPTLANRLEEYWLEPAVPLNIADMPSFQKVLKDVQKLVDTIDKHKWHGSKQLREWVQNAPRTWLTKRRETVLGDARNLVFAGLRETKVVERVETQMVSKADQKALGGGSGGDSGGDDEWDSAWDEPEEELKPPQLTKKADPSATDDDEGSAWDTEDMDEKASAGDGAGDDEGDAWGWGDEEASQQPPSPVAAKKQPSAVPNTTDNQPAQPSEREMTLRETFTVTAVPDGIFEIIQQVISDAQTLAGPEYASSPIAPAATALYTLPTLALAIYRATASTAYSKRPIGNMLIYNDCSHLASKLRDWQASQPPASRLRLDNDVKALETFAKRAYSSEMESQRTILRDLLDGAQGFSNSTKPPFKQECESAVEQTVDRLRDVQRQWKGVLSDGALLQSLGSLLATVTGKMITEIEDLGDIGEEDSHQLRLLLDKISEAKEMFYQQRSGSGEGAGEQMDMTFIYCPNWLKFQYLAEILESSLADIKYLWNEGELSLEFDAEEVVELIEGLFADSDIRRRTIQEIRRGGRR